MAAIAEKVRLFHIRCRDDPERHLWRSMVHAMSTDDATLVAAYPVEYGRSTRVRSLAIYGVLW
ncbi:hypothetical protein BH24CHL4_BH24CHL4_07270 [soil metagenome]